MLTHSMGTGARAADTGGMAELAQALPPARKGLGAAPKHDLAGYGQLLGAMKFMRWAIEQDRFPTIAAVMTHFNVCRATAYRWTRALAETYGVDPRTRHEGQYR